MYPDDVYRKRLSDSIAALQEWAARFEDTGPIETREGAGFWRLAARPATPGTCPMTLILRADQKFDLALAGERFEEQPVEDFTLFAGLAEAVASGNAEQLRSQYTTTGMARDVETRLVLADGRVWSRRRVLSSIPDEDAAGFIVRTTRFLPYRRERG